MILEAVEWSLHRLLHVPAASRVSAAHSRHHRLYHTTHHYASRTHIESAAQLGLACLLAAWVRGPFAAYVAWAVIVYNTMHWISHTSVWPTVTEYHRAHHRNVRRNVGVSSPVMDVLCGTMAPSFVVSRPLLLLLPAPLSFLAIQRRVAASSK